MAPTGLRDFPVRASIGVTDIRRAIDFYEGILGLEKVGEGPTPRTTGSSSSVTT